MVDQKSTDEVVDDVVDFDRMFGDYEDLSTAKGSFKYDEKSKKLIRFENRICM
jgi:hypothetical protein